MGAGLRLSERTSVGLRYADFDGKNSFGDVERFMIWFNFRVL